MCIQFIINIEQKLINYLYKRQGLTDRVLDLQIRLNKEKHKLDTASKDELLYDDFVQ